MVDKIRPRCGSHTHSLQHEVRPPEWWTSENMLSRYLRVIFLQHVVRPSKNVEHKTTGAVCSKNIGRLVLIKVMKISLKQLQIEGFRGFVDRTTVDMPSHGLHRIAGPSGSGKTGLVLAVAHAFGFADIPATELASWDWLGAVDNMEVTLDFQVGDQPASVSRGKRPTLTFGAEKKTGASVVSKALPGVLGIQPDLLKCLTWRPQKQPGLFLSLTDSEKKSFLTQVLGLENLEAEIERTQKQATAYESELQQCEHSLHYVESMVPTEVQPPEIQPLEPLEADLQKLLDSVGSLRFQLQNVHNRLGGMAKTRNEAIKGIETKYARLLEIARSAADSLRKERFQPSEALGQKVQSLKKRLNVIQTSMKKLQDQHRAELDKLKDQGTELKKTEAALRTKMDRLPGLETQLETAKSKLAQVEAGTCYVCGNVLHDAKHKAALKVSQDTIDRVHGELSEVAVAEQKCHEISTQLKALRHQYAELEKQDPVPAKFVTAELEYVSLLSEAEAEVKAEEQVWRANQQSHVSAAQAEVAKVQANRAEELQTLNMVPKEETELAQQSEELTNGLHELERQIDNQQHAINQVRIENKQRLETFGYQSSVRTKALKAVEEVEQHHRQVERSWQTEQDYLGLLKSFLGLVFDETLESIAARANEFLRDIPNCAGRTLEFISERETKTAKIKQEIRAVIRIDGHETSFKSGLSGGQQTAFELATDLSLAEVIAERTGVDAAFLFLDEPFDGLDVASKEACMQILARGADKRAIYVIDHSSEVQEMFSSTISLVTESGRTRVTTSVR